MKMHSGVFAALLALTVTGGALAETKVVRPGPAHVGRWELIGTTQANYTADHDVIVVKGPHDNFRRLKFRVGDAPLHIARMVVTYDNGEPDQIDVRENIPQGGESRSLDLRGTGQRSLRKIEFWYDTKGILKGRADVTVFGEK